MNLIKRIWIFVIVSTLSFVLLYIWQEFYVNNEFQPALNKRCIETSGYIPPMDGKLVLFPQNPSGYKQLEYMYSDEVFTLDLQNTKDRHSISQGLIAGKFASSPDGNGLIYEEVIGEKRSLVVDFRGTQKKIGLDLEEGFVYWLDDNNIVLFRKDHGGLPSTKILNVLTMESEISLPRYNDVIRVETYEFWGNLWPLAEYYSPDRTLVLYLADLSISQGQHRIIGDSFFSDLILFDKQNNIQLLKIEDFFKRDELRWTGKSDGFFLSLNNYIEEQDEGEAEIWYVDRNGSIKWVIKLTEFFIMPSIGNLSLSPDDRYLSFSIDIWSQAVKYDEHWLILDTITGDIFDFCLSTDYPALWSPDSQYVAIASGNSVYEVLSVLIIDIENQQIYEIADGYVPVGWIK
jgi:hypothetical protein